MKKIERENYIYNLIYQFVTIAFPIIITPYTARIFGADGIGDYSYTVAINTLFTLILTCMGRYGFREISYTQENRKERSNAFWEIVLMKTIIFIMLFIGYIFLIVFSREYKMLYLAQLISLVYALLDISWFWQGNENFKITASISALNKIFLIALIFIFVKDRNDLFLYAFLISFITFLGSVIMWLPLRKLIDKPQKLKIKRHIKNCILICIPFIIIELYSSVDKAMIGFITRNSFENGYYEQTVKITKMVMVVLTSMSLIKAPRHSKLAKDNNQDELKSSLYESFSFMLLLGLPITFGLCAISNKCVPLFLGTGYEKVITLMFWYAPFMILHGFVDILANQYFIPKKEQNVYTISVGASCVVNIILNILLIKYRGALGAIMATVISELFSCCILFYFAKNMLSLLKIAKENYQFLIAAFIMFIVCGITNYILKGYIMVNIIMQVIIGIITYFSILFAIKQEYFMFIFYNILLKIKRKMPQL